MAVVLFDGVCNLCSTLVRFIVARDPEAHFQFAALTSPAAARLLKGAPTAGALPDSLVLVDAGRVFTRSDAALRVARRLTLPWSLAYALVVVPRGVRDRLYDLVARRRYRWFGRRESCMVPTADIESRFIE